MKVFILFGQRKESYEGEYAPEALYVMTEYDKDANPCYLESKEKEYRDCEEFVSVRLSVVEVNQDYLREQLLAGNVIKL